ncbi:hypothetical protein KEM48_000306 [Puccinia striiformis f. sp. tritici PST-130]|nr:hypothetical protein KEM48_000306 [Puccinia striiformis f. sp. tritici PST-130]KAI9601330.1 hypothetical protein H4Q26_001146 [Puccinia striiformis f. sp. tritici PST-130]
MHSKQPSYPSSQKIITHCQLEINCNILKSSDHNTACDHYYSSLAFRLLVVQESPCNLLVTVITTLNLDCEASDILFFAFLNKIGIMYPRYRNLPSTCHIRTGLARSMDSEKGAAECRQWSAEVVG